MDGFHKVKTKDPTRSLPKILIFGRRYGRINLNATKLLTENGFQRTDIYVKDDGTEVLAVGVYEGGKRITQQVEFSDAALENANIPATGWTKFIGEWDYKLPGIRFKLDEAHLLEK